MTFQLLFAVSLLYRANGATFDFKTFSQANNEYSPLTWPSHFFIYILGHILALVELESGIYFSNICA